MNDNECDVVPPTNFSKDIFSAEDVLNIARLCEVIIKSGAISHERVREELFSGAEGTNVLRTSPFIS